MPWIAGVDGCKVGWVVALRNTETKSFDLKICFKFKDILDLQPSPEIIAIDIPIGLLKEKAKGGRPCDRAARDKLRPLRNSSVFSPPLRKHLKETEFTKGLGLSKQSFALIPKIKEVDDAMTVELQDRVFEVHPEVSFWAANIIGDTEKAMEHNKKTPAGQKEREDVLSRCFKTGWDEWWEKAKGRAIGNCVAIDDIIDAHIALWSAENIFQGKSSCLTGESLQKDQEKGLIMAIHY